MKPRFQLAAQTLKNNSEQMKAVHCKEHCVVLAGPGSGKTKTLTIAMARTLLQDIEEPQGMACVTYNNECAFELRKRLEKLGITTSGNVFIGTVHSFALTQIINPYAPCVWPAFRTPMKVATKSERDAAVEQAYKKLFGRSGSPRRRWLFAQEKRRRDVNRRHKDWIGKNVELAQFIEAYEGILRSQNLIDFDDMPLLAYRLVSEHIWIRKSVEAKFPVLFVDEYQDLGQALHELVLLLCFESKVRLFAVGDPDQSLYGFLGAKPLLLNSIAQRNDVETINLRLNYRCGRRIVEASMAALGEERDYSAYNNENEGIIHFHSVDGGTEKQAEEVFDKIIPDLVSEGVPLREIAILYKNKSLGDALAKFARHSSYPFVRADGNALVSRSSRFSRFIEACAAWTTGGWRTAEPSFRHIVNEAIAIVYGSKVTEEVRNEFEEILLGFLSPQEEEINTHMWLQRFKIELVENWRLSSTVQEQEWDQIDRMIDRTNPDNPDSVDISLKNFGGNGDNHISLSTFHSSKGREFDAVVIYGANAGIIPSRYDKTQEAIKKSRREFYVAVTRARKTLVIVFKEKENSPFVYELAKRLHPDSFKEE